MAWNRTRSEQRISELSGEWAQLSTLFRWESRIEGLRAENRQLRKRGLWVGGPRDFLGVIRRSRHELSHSALIAWLLDPCMRHGLGAVFLRRVLERCFPGEAFKNLDQAHSQTEVQCGQGRADIVVWGPGFTLVVENKVDAAEGQDQCDYYFRAFSDEIRPRFVFLTPEGRAASSVGEDATEAYRALSYVDVAEDLASALAWPGVNREAEARSVAEAYLETLRNEFRLAQ